MKCGFFLTTVKIMVIIHDQQIAADREFYKIITLRFVGNSVIFSATKMCYVTSQESNTNLNALLCSELSSKSERCDLRAAAGISKAFAHTTGNTAQLETGAQQTHDACKQTNK